MPTLTIKNYKRIENELVLEDLNNVNYFVGINGSGKSSIINAVSHLNDGGNANTFFTKNSVVLLEHNGKQRFIKWENENINPNHTSSDGKLRCIVVMKDNNTNSEHGANGVTKRIYNYNNVATPEQLDQLNSTIHFLGFTPLNAQARTGGPFSPTLGQTFFTEGAREVQIPFMAGGMKTVHDIFHSITEGLKETKGDHEHADIILILIEEPETALHPSLQKQIPVILDTILNDHKNLRKKICFCVSTHSPFIIGSALRFDNQKVYVLADAKLLGNNQQTTSRGPGYSGHDCAWIVSQMLGAEVTDLGYPENYVILEEFSMQLILEDAKEKGLIKNYQFVSASGINAAVDIAERMNQLTNLNTIVKCNPYYDQTYFMIVDNTSGFQPSELNKINKIKSQLGSRFIELSRASLEDYYPNIDIGIYNLAMINIKAAKRQDKGIWKANYARQITTRISTAADFSSLFNKELDILLR